MIEIPLRVTYHQCGIASGQMSLTMPNIGFFHSLNICNIYVIGAFERTNVPWFQIINVCELVSLA